MKVKNYRTFWWIMGIYALLVPLTYLAIGELDNQFIPNRSDLFSFPTIWQYITWTASWWNVLLGVLIVILVCNDINYKTQRQNIIDGLNRSQVILAKFYFLIMLATFVALYTFFIGATVGCVYSNPSSIFKHSDYVLIYFVQTLGYFAFAFFFSLLVRKPALSIILFIIIIALDIFLYLPEVLDHNAQFFPTITISELTPNPFRDILVAMERMGDPNYVEAPNMDQTTRSFLALAYISVFIIIGYFAVKRRDL